MDEKLATKLRILSDAAKYDASCASAGARQHAAVQGTGSARLRQGHLPHLHAGRALRVAAQDSAHQLLRLRLRVLREPPFEGRATGTFRVEEVVALTIDFYQRNYIEGYFSARASSAPPTIRWSSWCAWCGWLPAEHGFAGYIHLKTIPGGEPVAHRAGRAYGPTGSRSTSSCRRMRACGGWRRRRMPARSDAPWAGCASASTEARAEGRRFSPAGQSTQLVVGADAASDETVLRKSASLYRDYDLRRIDHSGFSPIPDASRVLPATAPPLRREHRLYQADWLLRYYGFACAISPRPRHPGCSGSTSIPSSPGRSNTASNSRSTSIAPIARRCCECRV